ncbi:BCNT-C domain-containing protein [Heracleum sosnowskyi]|uniref:BCNT-C domain-containing protein n=1 Tax=Heracleum sosnowskyi TaxID=360622 RepID=A0AAD8J668_9APIA|nr:BCNT-C domain-containing protein [Heracleum sosnowskyi]
MAAAQGESNSCTIEPQREVPPESSSQANPAETVVPEKKDKVDAVWQLMNKGVSSEKLNSILNKHKTTVNKTPKKSSSQVSPSWMTHLGLGPKQKVSHQVGSLERKPDKTQNGTSDESMKLAAAAALSAVKDSAAMAGPSGRGKVEITEIRDFAGQEVEVKKLVDADSKEAAEKAKTGGGAPSAIDSILEQIKKKPKLSVLDKTKKDWGEYKDENKGLEDELDAYKKSGNQYLDKMSFLQRTDYREFERERDARLAVQAKRKADM